MIRENILNDPDQIKKIDQSNMLAVVDDMGKMLADAKHYVENITLPKYKNIQEIVIAGMGGSGISGNLVKSLLNEELSIPIIVVKDYQLPSYVSQKSLLIAISYSGNTEETLSLYSQAQARKVPTISITSNGKLKKLAEQYKHPCLTVPGGFPPRAALPYLFLAVLGILRGLGLIADFDRELDETIALLNKLRRSYGSKSPTLSNPVKKLAQKLEGKTPFIFGSFGTTDSVAKRWKAQFNENSKTIAVYDYFPELCHNGIVGLFPLKKGQHDFSVVFLEDKSDCDREKKRMSIAKSLLGSQVGGIAEVASVGRSKLARMFSLIYFGDLLSVYLAILRGIDPTPIEAIDRLKREMAR